MTEKSSKRKLPNSNSVYERRPTSGEGIMSGDYGVLKGKVSSASGQINKVCCTRDDEAWGERSLHRKESNLRSISKSPEGSNRRIGEDVGKSSRNSILTPPKGTRADPQRGSDNESGYEVLEYVVERVDKKLMAVFKLPLMAIVLVVILWSFSVISTCYTSCLVVVFVLLAYLHAWNTIVEETLIVTSTLGIQVQQTNILGRLKYAKYVPMENIKAVVINEIIRRQRVISYLLIVLEVTESTGKIMVPLMTGTLPRLRTIEQIYQHVHKVIF